MTRPNRRLGCICFVAQDEELALVFQFDLCVPNQLKLSIMDQAKSFVLFLFRQSIFEATYVSSSLKFVGLRWYSCSKVKY